VIRFAGLALRCAASNFRLGACAEHRRSSAAADAPSRRRAPVGGELDESLAVSPVGKPGSARVLPITTFATERENCRVGASGYRVELWAER
jgi:hypothetical protein